MELLPAIDLRGGRCVRLRQGDYAQETVYGDDPGAVAKGFVDAGARWIHVVDLDAARSGTATNHDAIRAIVRHAEAVPVQCGGGVRSVPAAEALFALGVHRVVVGTAAVEDPALVPALASAHPERVAVGLDVRADEQGGYEVAVRGWTEGSGLQLFDVLQRFEGAGVAAVVATEIGRDGMLVGPDVDLYRLLLEATSMAVVASGGVGTIEHLTELAALRATASGGLPSGAYLGRRGLDGVIVGKALYEGRFDVSQALAACAAAEGLSG